MRRVFSKNSMSASTARVRGFHQAACVNGRVVAGIGNPDVRGRG